MGVAQLKYNAWLKLVRYKIKRLFNNSHFSHRAIISSTTVLKTFKYLQPLKIMLTVQELSAVMQLFIHRRRNHGGSRGLVPPYVF